MKEITVKLPLGVIQEILHKIPRKDAEKLLKASYKNKVKSVSAQQLRKLDGITSIGGNAVKDTETLWQ